MMSEKSTKNSLVPGNKGPGIPNLEDGNDA
jgi:hypothetical protein